MQKIKKSRCTYFEKTDRFKDFRGYYIETFNKKNGKKNLNKLNLFKMISHHQKNILRGFHGDAKTMKYFFCVHGKIQIAFINNDKNSKFFKKNFSMILEENDNIQILVPPKYGVAHLVLSEKAILHYKQNTYYGKNKQFTINYKSKCLSFKWKSKKIIVSKRDSKGLFY